MGLPIFDADTLGALAEANRRKAEADAAGIVDKADVCIDAEFEAVEEPLALPAPSDEVAS